MRFNCDNCRKLKRDSVLRAVLKDGRRVRVCFKCYTAIVNHNPVLTSSGYLPEHKETT